MSMFEADLLSFPKEWVYACASRFVAETRLQREQARFRREKARPAAEKLAHDPRRIHMGS